MDSVKNTQLEQSATEAGLIEVYHLFTGRVLPLLKKNADKIEKRQFKEVKDPFNPIYKAAVNQVYRIMPHSSTDYFPKELFENLSPHRKGEEAEWIRNNYEPVTLPVWMDFQSTLKRGANENNYKIVWQKEMPPEYEGNNSPQNYLSDQIKLFGSLGTWFRNVLFDVKLKDANGVIAVQPYELDIVEDEEGARMINPDSMIEPIPVYYSSQQIICFEEDEYYMVLSEDRVKLSDQYNAKKGYVFYYFDKDRIIRIEQVGKFQDWTFDFIVYFEHEWGALPVWKLKGQPDMRGRHIYFQSPFDFAVGNLNLALKNQINKQMAEANGAWPHKIMIANPCDNVGDNGVACRDGWIWKDDAMGPDGTTGADVICNKCHGTGALDKPSPGSTTVVDETKLTGDNNIGLDRIRFISPSSEILKHLGEEIHKNQVQARDILHIYSTNSMATGTDPTATGKWIDNNAMLAFIMPIVTEAFDIYEGVAQAITYMRYGDSVDAPRIVRPTNYDFLTSGDYLNEYLSLLEKGAPPVVLYKVLEMYVERMYFADGADKKVFKLILASDPYVTKKDDEIRNMLGAGTIAKWQALLHHSVFHLIDMLAGEDENFFEKDIMEQREALYQLAQDEAAKITSSNPSVSPDNFLDRIAEPTRNTQGQREAA